MTKIMSLKPHFAHTISILIMPSARLLGSTMFINCQVISLHATCMMITIGLSLTNINSTKCFKDNLTIKVGQLVEYVRRSFFL